MNGTATRALTAAAILGFSGLCSPASAQRIAGQVVFGTGFEAPTLKLGPLAGQDGWTVNPPLTVPESGVVQEKIVSEGSAAALFSAGPLGCVLAEWTRAISLKPGAASIVDVDWDLNLQPSARPAGGWGMWVYADDGVPVAGMYTLASSGDNIFYSTGDPAGVMADTRIERGVWTHFQIHMDYMARTVSFLVNGMPIEQNGLDAVAAPNLKVGSTLTGIGVRAARPGTDAVALDMVSVTTLSLGCYANCDQSVTPPVLNVNDFVCFQTSFAMATGLDPQAQITSYANCDGSSIEPVLNVDDFICFLNRFAKGCM